MIVKNNYYTDPKDRYVKLGEKQFNLTADNGFEGKDVIVDENIHNPVKMIIQRHTNPLNKDLHDLKAKFLTSNIIPINRGNVLSFDNQYYIAVTEPFTNGIYSEYKIVPVIHDSTIQINDVDMNIKCLQTNYKSYIDASYSTENQVFEDNEMSAILVQLNSDTENVKLFDRVTINGILYNVVQVDKIINKVQSDSLKGVLQLVLIRSLGGQIFNMTRNQFINGVLKFTKLKDYMLSAKSRELVSPRNVIDSGEYIEHTFIKDDIGTLEKRHYLIRSDVNTRYEYDTSLALFCDRFANLLDSEGNVVSYGLSFWDNKTRMRANDNQSATIANTNFEAFIRNDEITGRLGYDFSRIMVKDPRNGKYQYLEVVQTDPFSHNGIINLSFKYSSYRQSEDNLELGIADYQKQLALTKPTQPTGTIQGKDELFLTEVGDYELVGIVNPSTEWSISSPNAQLIVIDDTRCQVKCLSANNETVTLSAKLGTATFTKEIMLARW